MKKNIVLEATTCAW